LRDGLDAVDCHVVGCANFGAEGNHNRGAVFVKLFQFHARINEIAQSGIELRKIRQQVLQQFLPFRSIEKWSQLLRLIPQVLQPAVDISQFSDVSLGLGDVDRTPGISAQAHYFLQKVEAQI
jgi:hypothetical protein